MRRRLPAAVLAGLIAGLAGCASGPGTVDREMVLPAGAERHVIDPGHQRFLMAAPIADPMPAFPDDPATRRDAARGSATQVIVCATFVVDTDGQTVDIATAPTCEPDAVRDPVRYGAYRAAVEQALAQWQWFAAAVCTHPDHAFPDDASPDDACRASGVRIDAVPIRLDYRFYFEPGGRISRQAAPRGDD